MNDVSEHRTLVDGHHYWIARMNSRDAAARGIGHGDLVRLFNDRGGVICAVRVSERVRLGVVHSYESAAVYEPVGDPGCSDDRGGCVNLPTPRRPSSSTLERLSRLRLSLSSLPLLDLHEARIRCLTGRGGRDEAFGGEQVDATRPVRRVPRLAQREVVPARLV